MAACVQEVQLMKAQRIMALVLAMLLLIVGAVAETAADTVIAVVNGEQLLESEYLVYENQYLQTYANAGCDVNDETIKAYLQDVALTAAIQEMLIRQDMTAHDCFSFDAETEAWLTREGKAAYEAALAETGEMLREQLGMESDVDMLPYAMTYAKTIGVTEADYINVYRNQYANINYYHWLLTDNPVTDEDVQTAYNERVEASRVKYEHDAAAFETDMYAGEEVWYRPEGYRGVLRILLAAEGSTAEAKLASVQTVVDEIYAKLNAGESFQTLMAAYDTTGIVNQQDLMAVGYQVHRDSVIWDEAFVAAAFSEEMAQPGCWSQPLVSERGVFILYYLADYEAGPITMSDDVYDTLAYILYSERGQEAANARLQQLMDSADVTLY